MRPADDLRWSELENLVGSKRGYSSPQTEAVACWLFTCVVVVTELCIQHLTKHFFFSLNLGYPSQWLQLRGRNITGE